VNADSAVGFAPAAGIVGFMVLQRVWDILTQHERAARAAPAQRVIITPPPKRAPPPHPTVAPPPAAASSDRRFTPPPPHPPVVRWTSDRELLAWRAWRLARWGPDGGLRLLSMTASWAWDGPVFGADFLPFGSDANKSGVYALKWRPCPQIDWLWGEHCWVLGWVALSGRVVEHRYGYRAERAVIRRLRLGVGTYLKVESHDDLVGVQEELERRYQAPVRLGGFQRRIARRLWDELPLFHSGAGIGVVRPEAGWRVG
jgi:hypothetical protein